MNKNRIYFKRIKNIVFIGIPVISVILSLYVLQAYNYLLFHTTIESLSTLIAFTLFVLAWNARKFIKNSFFLQISFAYTTVGILDFIHALSYKGMNIFPNIATNEPTQLWIASRLILAVSLFTAPFFINKKFNLFLTFLIYSLITILALISIFYWKIIPACYVEGTGLTPFKKVMEIVISLLFLGSIIMLQKYKDKFDKRVFTLLIHSLILNIIAELLLISYMDVYGILNMLGHFVILFSYYFVYKAIIEIGLTKPYRLLFLELEELNKRKDEFLSMASHELKTPITSIKLYSQILNRQFVKNKDSTNKDLVNKINQQADKLSKLINDLMDVSKIEAGKITYNMKKFSLDELVSQVINESSNFSNNHNIILTGNIKTKICADKDKIAQVLINLINNAIKYSPKGGNVFVATERDINKVNISVKDSGIGIPKNKQQYIFEKYYRTEKGEKSAEGLGLGLFIVKEIISYHKGKIWVESKKGKGTTFHFSLPIQ